MAQSLPEAASPSTHQSIFDGALEVYKRKTGRDLSSHPLLRKLETCHSPDAILDVLQTQVLGPHQSRNSGDKLTRYLNPTVNVLNSFSATIGGGISLAYPPACLLFTGMGILLSAASAVSASQSALVDLFERIENVFRRLETYIEVPPTTGMMDSIVKVMAEVLCILAIATKEIKQNRTKTFLKKLVGRTDIEDALQRLERVTVEEARMAAAEALKAIHSVGNKVGDKVHDVQGTLKAVEDRVKGVEGMLQDVGDMLQGVDDRVKGIDGKIISGPQIAKDLDVASMEALKPAHGVDDKINVVNDRAQGVQKTLEGASMKASDAHDVQGAVQGIKAMINNGGEELNRPIARDLGDLSGNQSRQLAAEWLSPPDPSVNYNTTRASHHRGTAVWFTRSSAFRDWKGSGSLMWIHGKPGSGKSVLTSEIIQDIDRISKARSAFMAYFFFDFKDAGKQDSRAFLSSILVQLSNQSVSFRDILREAYVAHQSGSQEPSDSALLQCLEKMLRVQRQLPIYVIADALDECPDVSGVQSPREKVLELIEELVGFRIPNLRLCVTSRPEVDIWNVLEPLTFASHSVSLHDQDGQKKDISDYVHSVVYSDRKIMRWREEDKTLLVKTLSDRADGMFRWVSCQIEALRRCLAPSVRRVLEELPETLDETYKRILQEIPKANRIHSHRLLQCLAVAVRPLRVQELAEVLAVDFHAAGGIPKLIEDLRWEDQEQAVLSACSSLISVVNFRDSRVVQFSHFSVKEFLTSDRLAASMSDASRYHIRVKPAHTIIAQACVGVLLRLEYPIDKERRKRFPLADYAAKHFADHAEFGNVISNITDGIDHLLDEDRPHFAAWMSDISTSWWAEKDSGQRRATPLYHVADLGFCGLVQHLISKRPEDIIARGGVHGTPVHAALHRRHVKLCQLLLPYCVGLDVRDLNGQTPLHVAASNALLEAAQMIVEQGTDINAQDNNGGTPLHQAIDTYPLLKNTKLEIMRLLLDHGADSEALNNQHNTPLHLAAYYGQLASAQVLVKHGADLGVPSSLGRTPLHDASWYGHTDIIRLFLEHGANVEARDNLHNTPLHLTACTGELAAAQLLIEHGSVVHLRNVGGRTPLHLASLGGHSDVMRLLLEHRADVDAQDQNDETPLHATAHEGKVEATQLLLAHGANVHARNKAHQAPFQIASAKGNKEIIQLLSEHVLSGTKI